ncbi:MAG: hypothetical protein ERJ68_00155 [Aphanocapsa feldmannii 277cI]|uniref:Uncharacterized protein n=1 Tax=Aphanocapsa feldmannii 277cI TaxID=2507554 RepID=A0A524RVZ7_9CHRO|nr:MAG: hypothetical protein ERJ68_00155 [Aphanocapsa feldmannii 277cI]
MDRRNRKRCRHCRYYEDGRCWVLAPGDSCQDTAGSDGYEVSADRLACRLFGHHEQHRQAQQKEKAVPRNGGGKDLRVVRPQKMESA